MSAQAFTADGDQAQVFTAPTIPGAHAVARQWVINRMGASRVCYFTIERDLMDKLDAISEASPHLTKSLIVNEALRGYLEGWLEHPKQTVAVEPKEGLL